MRRPAHRDQSDLFGYIQPVTQETSVHPPLCACGECQTPVETFAVKETVYANGWKLTSKIGENITADRPL